MYLAKCGELRIFSEGVCTAMPGLTSSGLFIIRVHKSLVTSPLNPWSNSYEFQADDPVSTADLQNAALACALWETALTRDLVQYNRATVSTWAEDSHPYDPATFMTVPLTGTGGLTGEADTLALNQTFRIARTPATGRAGHIFLRAALEEGQVSAPAGISILVDVDGMNDTVQTALTSSELENYIGAAPLGPLHMVLVNKAGTQIRNVLSLTAQGVTTLPTDHRWFNRPTPPEVP